MTHPLTPEAGYPYHLNIPLADALEFAHSLALRGQHHTSPDWRACEFFPCDAYARIEQAAVARLVARLSRLPRTSIRDGTETGRMVVDWADLSAVLAEDDPPDEDVSKVIAKARAEAHVRQTLIDHGVDSVENQGLHGWRCRYPDTYGGGPCDCFDELVAALLAVPEAQEDDRE